ncbi:pilus assembly protein TadG-related protein [Mesorhizobium sp. 1B3]|uniref:pilus assembly protein TadG-related protein n=1 Tax=Mesorhizobium sp. 1B3 TaxID=3243599 RepID=UPI003D965143
MSMRRFRSRLFQFVRRQDGGVLPLAAASMVALIGAVGLAVDGGRLVLMHSSLQRAIDAGGLSAVAKLGTTTLDDEVRKFTAVNFADGYIGANITSLTSALSSDKKTLTVQAAATAPTTFMSLFGIHTMSTSAETVIERAVGGLELVLVLDNTGSMGGSPLRDLKTATNSLLDILFGDQVVGEKLYVGVVPFSQSVNIGATHSDWLTPGSLKGLDWGPTKWGGCVEARADGYDETDDVPSMKTFAPYYWKDSDKNRWRNSKSSLGQSLGPNKHCPAEVTPMTSTKSKLVTAVRDMEAVGNTHVNYGAVWGWRMLSPKWRGLWGGDMNNNELPLDYGTESMNKAAVIMTDGENTMTSTTYTAYGWLEEKRLGTDRSSEAVGELNDRLAAVCTAMKNAGIIVYTIAFNRPGKSIEDLLRGCATQPAFYFNSPSGSDLKTAFEQIGGSLSNLRVSR